MTPHTDPATFRATFLGTMAGRSAYAIRGHLIDAEGTRHDTAVTLIGDADGSDAATGVVLLSEGFPEGIRVTDAGRFGPWGLTWVRRFYGLTDRPADAWD